MSPLILLYPVDLATETDRSAFVGFDACIVDQNQVTATFLALFASAPRIRQPLFVSFSRDEMRILL